MLSESMDSRDWESVLAAIGHGGLKEGQVINKMVEEYERSSEKRVTDARDSWTA